MADKPQRSFDVWILETNTVYQSVPFTVVTDWIQQGRLLAEDKLRAPGGQKWVPIGEIKAFAAYLPKAEPFRAEDRAEALAPVQADIPVRHGGPGTSEEEDVDMIPLIDVSLVLLVFFMMTTTVSSAAGLIALPEAANKFLQTSKPETMWVGIDRGPDGQPTYSLGESDKGEGTPFDTQAALVARLTEMLKAKGAPTEVRVRANRELSYKYVRDMALELGKLRQQRLVSSVMTEVTEKQK